MKLGPLYIPKRSLKRPTQLQLSQSSPSEVRQSLSSRSSVLTMIVTMPPGKEIQGADGFLRVDWKKLKRPGIERDQTTVPITWGAPWSSQSCGTQVAYAYLFRSDYAEV